jgi:protein arginine N-methyltransferase 5
MQAMASSPMMDPEDLQPHQTGEFYGKVVEREKEERLVKIGQTSLHNPGGRSSWIGL